MTKFYLIKNIVVNFLYGQISLVLRIGNQVLCSSVIVNGKNFNLVGCMLNRILVKLFIILTFFGLILNLCLQADVIFILDLLFFSNEGH